MQLKKKNMEKKSQELKFSKDLTKEKLIKRFLTFCETETTYANRVSAVKTQYNRDCWQIDDVYGRIIIKKTDDYPHYRIYGWYKDCHSNDYEISEKEYVELKDKYFEDITVDENYIKSLKDSLAKSKNTKDTGLKDSFGNPICAGDTLLWEYQTVGTESADKNGKLYFMGCYPGNEIREMKYEQVVKYEVGKDSAGYFLDIPCGIGTTFLKGTIKCTVIKKFKDL